MYSLSIDPLASSIPYRRRGNTFDKFAFQWPSAIGFVLKEKGQKRLNSSEFQGDAQRRGRDEYELGMYFLFFGVVRCTRYV